MMPLTSGTRGAAHAHKGGLNTILRPVLDPPMWPSPEPLVKRAREMRAGLVASALANLNLPVTWSVAIETDVAAGIVSVAENGEDTAGVGVFGRCDVIAMATHGRGGMQRWALGSITERVLHATSLPLLVVRPTSMLDKSKVTWDAATLSAIQG